MRLTTETDLRRCVNHFILLGDGEPSGLSRWVTLRRGGVAPGLTRLSHHPPPPMLSLRQLLRQRRLGGEEHTAGSMAQHVFDPRRHLETLVVRQLVW